ncbi:UDP-glucose/GDP-mannose dehydrogenase family protein [Ketobacter sp. MCCC 1A13808]|uniref:UDP-glucose dehydrogenase family protein n=1 Tax=Ketobacter sp. MCCC 1A13808 TaxID=2602738 RepID=UPI000F11EC31|nr:UDP-glucose/GDP-mannose dehydrogenase family protein [Ketobacter sp. MCCC 1A13808]MVF11634.1 UDP-glucose/GDP-mannose dehydrogenase family protein [Ketobacter sp. MCCC 1A13808]RLP55250.1 MAG: UDP-glucose/GDP-mannose dehydrogenase family protein [Ketobacter sp.]
MNITVFGTGYVGLVTGASLADVGHNVLCMDVDVAKIESLKKGIVTIHEPGLDVVVQRCFEDGTLNFSSSTEEAVAHGELIFIAVGTPPDEDGSADLQYVLQVAANIGRNMQDYKVIVNKSTVPVGTADKVKAAVAAELEARSSPLEFDVCSNPEFLKEGSALEDFNKGARIVVGTDSDRVVNIMRVCYGPYIRNHDKLMFMDVRAAELTKYAANAMLATKISFMNEMSQLAERLGVDIEQVRKGIGSDPRIGYQFIYPGCGYGGSCFPKDVKALAQTARTVGYVPELLDAVENVNTRQKGSMFEKLSKHFNGDLNGKTIALWGLSFKPDTDDMREAPSRDLMEALWAAGAKIQAFDPVASKECRRIYGDRPDLVLCEQRNDAVSGADALAICTEWKAFRFVDLKWLKSELKNPVIVDGRNLYSPADTKEFGFKYYAIGRSDSLAI